jgi:hypothetical protein
MTERIEADEPDPDATGGGVLGAGCCEAHPAAITAAAVANPSHRHIVIRASSRGPRRIFGIFPDYYRCYLAA